jgi:hypothetical protein
MECRRGRDLKALLRLMRICQLLVGIRFDGVCDGDYNGSWSWVDDNSFVRLEDVRNHNWI